MGGILVALQALMSYKRAKAMEDTANAQADAANAQAKATEEQAKANRHTEQGQRQERMKNAIEHLGHESDSVRLGGAYELFHLAEDTKEWRQTVLDILCAHIRQTTGEDAYREAHKFKPSEEVQSLLTLLFVQEHWVFKGRHINLKGSWLNGADLFEARLAKANLTKAHLKGVELFGANLQKAKLTEANLQEADLITVDLEGADLEGADLEGANLIEAYLQGADLSKAWPGMNEAYLQGANLWKANLQGADLGGAQLQGVDLSAEQLQGANLEGAQLQGADLEGAQMQGVRCEDDLSNFLSFEKRLRRSIGRKSDFSGVIFVGGLSQEKVDSLVKDLPDEKADDLREKLTPHIGQPVSSELPEDSGAITGTYTEEEAKKWIAEYEETMSEIPGDDS